MLRKRVALFGGTGFVGSAVREALSRDNDVVIIPTPRLTTKARTVEQLIATADAVPALSELVRALAGMDVVVNAAGDPDASSLDLDRLFGANALLPRVLLLAAAGAGVQRMIHISSAVVQNDKPMLDASEEKRPFSPYSASKVAGEEVLRLQAPASVEVVRYRPPSVHAPGRRVTRMISKIASSPLSSVARPGDQPTPQALLPNVADAVGFLATAVVTPPAIVVHPSEGVTVTSLMRDLGNGREPIRLPRWFARFVIVAAKMVGRLHRPTASNARRVELLWMGQPQARSWLSAQGWEPSIPLGGWAQLSASNSSEGAKR